MHLSPPAARRVGATPHAGPAPKPSWCALTAAPSHLEPHGLGSLRCCCQVLDRSSPSTCTKTMGLRDLPLEHAPPSLKPPGTLRGTPSCVAELHMSLSQPGLAPWAPRYVSIVCLTPTVGPTPGVALHAGQLPGRHPETSHGIAQIAIERRVLCALTSFPSYCSNTYTIFV
jgi:hypothetical protein